MKSIELKSAKGLYKSSERAKDKVSGSKVSKLHHLSNAARITALIATR